MFRKGCNIVLMVPTISLLTNKFYIEHLKNITEIRSLPPITFEGYDFPLLIHLSLLFFIQPQKTERICRENKGHLLDQETIADIDAQTCSILKS